MHPVQKETHLGFVQLPLSHAATGFYKGPAKVAVNCKNPSGHFRARGKVQENFTKNFQIVGQAAFDNENIWCRVVSPEQNFHCEHAAIPYSP